MRRRCWKSLIEEKSDPQRTVPFTPKALRYRFHHRTHDFLKNEQTINNLWDRVKAEKFKVFSSFDNTARCTVTRFLTIERKACMGPTKQNKNKNDFAKVQPDYVGSPQSSVLDLSSPSLFFSPASPSLANPHVHQHHNVWTMAFRSGLPQHL